MAINANAGRPNKPVRVCADKKTPKVAAAKVIFKAVSTLGQRVSCHLIEYAVIALNSNIRLVYVTMMSAGVSGRTLLFMTSHARMPEEANAATYTPPIACRRRGASMRGKD